MSLVSLSDAQDRVGDSVTQDEIDEVEDDLTRLIGPLVGERTETFFFSERYFPWYIVDGLYLTRRTDFGDIDPRWGQPHFGDRLPPARPPPDRAHP